MLDTVRLHELTREDVRAIAANAVVAIPTGAIEQHGPHMPISTDIIIATSICEAAARAARRDCLTLVAPGLAYGISNHHKPHPGVMSLSAASFMTMLTELCECLIEGGFSRIAIVNGHNGNDDAVKMVGREINNRHHVTIGATSYAEAGWNHYVEAGLTEEAARIPGHAGKFETSLITFLRPELVQADKIPPDIPTPSETRLGKTPRIFAAGSKHGLNAGYSDSPRSASREFGERCFNASVAGVAELFVNTYRKHKQIAKS